MEVALTPSVLDPVPVGTVVTWSATVSDASAGTLWYRFRSREFGADYRLIRDYGPLSTLDWTVSTHEGTYDVEVAVINRDTGESAATDVTYQISPQVANVPAVNPTSNPLVFLYSAPPCDPGSRMRVLFQTSGGAVQTTPFKACTSGLTMNFYLAGLLADTSYTASSVIDTGSQFITGPLVSFATSDAQPPAGLFTAAPVSGTAGPGILLASTFVAPAATDLNGNLVWYATNGIAYITSSDPGGYFWGVMEDSALDQSYQTIRRFDLTGITLLETNAARVNEQLAAMGKRQIGAFHHEVKTLPDGRIAALATVEQILTGVQGPGPVDIIGDMIVVFDANLNVVWTWDTFDHLDVTRAAVLGENCLSQLGTCPPYYLAAGANDWTHGNAIQQTPDGNLLYSSRHQDWVIKIQYNNGEGDGSILWRLGLDGDFQINSTDPYPWFSHQHYANFLFSDPTTLLVFDNGNTRIQTQGGGNSRGQALQIDEQNRVANLLLNADLGVYSLAFGSAEKLPNGDIDFDAGYVLDQSSPVGAYSYNFEVNSTANIVYEAQATGLVYRWLRMADIYTPPN
jgi:hypothetical protein